MFFATISAAQRVQKNIHVMCYTYTRTRDRKMWKVDKMV